MADIVVGVIAADVFFDSVVVTALADVSVAAFAGAIADTALTGAADVVGGELASTFVGDFLSTAAQEVGTAAVDTAATTAEGLTGTAAGEATGESNIAEQAAQNSGIAPDPQTHAGLPQNAAQTVNGPPNTNPNFDPNSATADTLPPYNAPSGAQPGTPTDPSVWNRVTDWLDKNKTIATAGGQVLGGIGKGLLESSAMSKKIAADKEIAQNKAAWDLQAKRANMASSGAFNQQLGFSAPPIPQPLRRPDGTLVYTPPGIIFGQPR